MEKKVLEEIVRVREIMGLKLITEGSFGPPKFLDELFQELAERARTGDSALAGRFDDFLEGLKKTGKNVGDLNDYAFGVKNAGRDITEDLGDQLDDVYKFVDELVNDAGNGTLWKTYLTDALKNSSDNVFKSIGDQLGTAKNTLKNMGGYTDELHDEAVDALTNMKNLINNSNLDDELKPILLARYGLDNIPTKRVVTDVTDDVVDQVDDVIEDIADSPEAREEAINLLDPKKWPDTNPLSQSEIDSIKKKIDQKVLNFFRNWFTSSNQKIEEMTKILKTLQEKGTTITAQERTALEKKFATLTDSIWINNRKLFNEINTWFDQISSNDRNLANIIYKLKGVGEYGKKAVVLVDANNSISNWWFAIKQGLANAFEGEIELLGKVSKKIRQKEWYKAWFGAGSDEVKKATGGFGPWLLSGSRKGFPYESNKNYKEIIENSGLPLAKKTYAMELLYRTAKWKVIFAILATGRNAIAFAFNTTESTDCKNKIEKIKQAINNDPNLKQKLTDSNGKIIIPTEPITKDPYVNPDGTLVPTAETYKTPDGTLIAMPESCKANSLWKAWSDDFASGPEGGGRFSDELFENLLDVSFGDSLTDFIPGKLDDLFIFGRDLFNWWGTNKTWEEMVSKIDEDIVFVQGKIEEGQQKVEEVIDETNKKIPTKEEQQASLDSLNLEKPELPETETTTPVVPGTASNQVKEDFKKYINNDTYFSKWFTKINDKGDGKIQVIYANEGQYKYDETTEKPFYDILRKEGDIWVLDKDGKPY